MLSRRLFYYTCLCLGNYMAICADKDPRKSWSTYDTIQDVLLQQQCILHDVCESLFGAAISL